MPTQLEILDLKRPESREEPPKLRWENYGDGHWRSTVKNVGEGFVCQKCAQPITPGGPASLTIDTGVQQRRLTADDFKKIQYWHYKLNCPEIIEDEPL